MPRRTVGGADAAGERARLTWRCRRGMRELELLLARFVERELDALAPRDRAALERLLEHPDQDLLVWVTGAAEPADPALARIAAAIRRTAR